MTFGGEEGFFKQPQKQEEQNAVVVDKQNQIQRKKKRFRNHSKQSPQRANYNDDLLTKNELEVIYENESQP